MREKFFIRFVILMCIFMGIALWIDTTPFFRWVLWGLFVYILAKDLVDEMAEQQKSDEIKALIDKIDRIIEQIKRTI